MSPWRACLLGVLAFAGMSACGGGEPAAQADPPPAREVREIVPGAGRMAGGAFVVDVQVGHAIGQGRVAGGVFTVEGAAAVKP